MYNCIYKIDNIRLYIRNGLLFMYAIFQIGKKQYRVVNDQSIYIDRVHVDVGNQIEFDQVLFIRNNNDVRIGNPFIKNVKIITTVLSHHLNKKIQIIKFRRRKHSLKSQGHRQCMTKIKIINISKI